MTQSTNNFKNEFVIGILAALILLIILGTAPSLSALPFIYADF